MSLDSSSEKRIQDGGVGDKPILAHATATSNLPDIVRLAEVTLLVILVSLSLVWIESSGNLFVESYGFKSREKNCTRNFYTV